MSISANQTCQANEYMHNFLLLKGTVLSLLTASDLTRLSHALPLGHIPKLRSVVAFCAEWEFFAESIQQIDIGINYDINSTLPKNLLLFDFYAGRFVLFCYNLHYFVFNSEKIPLGKGSSQAIDFVYTCV